MKKTLILSITALTLITVQGCDVVHKPPETKEAVEIEKVIKSKKDKQPDVAGINLPEKTTEESYAYKNKNLKSPFSQNLEKQESSGIKPDFDRKKDRLEQYALSNIILKGTMSVKNGPREALVVTGDGKIHTVKVGDFMGKNYGKVLSIKSEELKVRELYKDSNSIWSIKMTTKKQQ